MNLIINRNTYIVLTKFLPLNIFLYNIYQIDKVNFYPAINAFPDDIACSMNDIRTVLGGILAIYEGYFTLMTSGHVRSQGSKCCIHEGFTLLIIALDCRIKTIHKNIKHNTNVICTRFETGGNSFAKARNSSCF